MQLTDLTWPRVQALPRETPVVIPIAALEQHGHHMPLFTDSLLLAEVIRRASESLKARVLFAPLQWLGNSDHHMDLPGTLSAAPRLYLDLLSGLAENFVSHGFKRIMFVNGHGGNDVPGRQVVFELRQKHRARKDLLFLFGEPAEGEPVGRHHPLEVRLGEMELRADRRERDVDNRKVGDGHEERDGK